ncbi:hypothetical protein Q3G72_014293 [Acer saccharum]|nr:hypothetical protein Q3G72_014293 [Acer saccharum]
MVLGVAGANPVCSFLSLSGQGESLGWVLWLLIPLLSVGGLSSAAAAGPTKDGKPGPGKLDYGTDLTKQGLMEQDFDLNKELESGRAGKNQCDSEWGSSSFNAAYRSINQCRRSELHLYGSRARSLSQEGKNRTMFNDSAEKIRAQEGTLSHTFHVTMNSFLIRKQSSTYVPFSSTQGISTKQSICVPPIVARPV